VNQLLEHVNAVCQHVRESNKHGVTFKKLIVACRTEFKKQDFDLIIKTKKDKTLDSTEFYVNAFYDAEDDFNQDTAIEIVIYHNFSDVAVFSQNQITEFLIQMYDATVHEYRHQWQSAARGYVSYTNNDHTPYHQYLKDSDELDAYGFSIAIELLRHMSKHRAKRYMSRITIMAKLRQGNTLVSPNLKSYIDHFVLNRVTKKIAKKVYKHLDVLDNRYIFV
jgi:hypothetical protein